MGKNRFCEILRHCIISIVKKVINSDELILNTTVIEFSMHNNSITKNTSYHKG